MIAPTLNKTLWAAVLIPLLLASACNLTVPLPPPITTTTTTAPPTTTTAPPTTTTSTPPPAIVRHYGNYLLASSPISQRTLDTLAQVDEFRGVSVVYNWVELETEMGVYDFSQVESDLALMRTAGKQLTVMIRDKSFGNNQFVPVPAYLLTGEYAGGYVEVPGKVSVAKRWNPAVSARFIALVRALGAAVGGAPELEGMKTSESATMPNPGPDFTASAYATQLKLYADAMAEAFPGKANFLYLNWGLNATGTSGQSLLTEVALYAASVGVGIGGPDVHPDVAIPAYPLYPLVAASVPTMIEVQYSDYDHVVPAGDTEQLFDFAVNTLDVSYICWKERRPYVDAMIATVRAHPAFAG